MGTYKDLTGTRFGKLTVASRAADYISPVGYKAVNWLCENYEPSNCRWTAGTVQANNTRHNHLVTYRGETLTLSQWASKTGINYHKLKDRINKLGWAPYRALSTK